MGQCFKYEVPCDKCSRCDTIKILAQRPQACKFCRPSSSVCLGFTVPLEICYSYRDVTITGEGLQILTYVRHSWPLSSEGVLQRATTTVTRSIRLEQSSPRTRDNHTHTYCRTFSSETVTTRFYELGLSRLGFKHTTFHLRGERSNPLRHSRVPSPSEIFSNEVITIQNKNICSREYRGNFGEIDKKHFKFTVSLRYPHSFIRIRVPEL